MSAMEDAEVRILDQRVDHNHRSDNSEDDQASDL